MQRCVKCKESFSYKEVLVAVWASGIYGKIECKKCHQIHRISKVSRGVMAMIIALPILLERYIFNLNINVIVFLLVYYGGLITITPFVVRYRLLEELI